MTVQAALGDIVSNGAISANDTYATIASAFSNVSEDAIRMTQVAADLSVTLGISVEEAQQSLAQAAQVLSARHVAEGGKIRSDQMSIGINEYGLLMRVANMAAQLLKVCRNAADNPEDYARYRALRDALLALQMEQTTLAAPQVGDDAVVEDLMELVASLEPPTTP